MPHFSPAVYANTRLSIEGILFSHDRFHPDSCSYECQDMQAAMDSMSNMWQAPPSVVRPYNSDEHRVALLQSTHAHNPEGARDCNYSECQALQSAMTSLCNMWGLESRFPILGTRIGQQHRRDRAFVEGHMPSCGGEICRARNQAIIAFVNAQRTSIEECVRNGGTAHDGLFTYPRLISDAITMSSTYVMATTPTLGTITEGEDTETVPCARGENCRFFISRGRHRMTGAVLCTSCGVCPTCTRQCDYSSSWQREGTTLQCCLCLGEEHHHCASCSDWLGSDEDDTCASCSQQYEEEQQETDREQYDFNNTDVSHLIYNCDSCGRQVGSCTCVLAYL